MIRWLAVIAPFALLGAKAMACPSCTGDTPPNEDGLQASGEALAYGLSIAMLLGAPAFMTCALGFVAVRSVKDQPPGETK